MRNIKLTKQEKNIEKALLRGEYVKVSKNEFKDVAESIRVRKEWLSTKSTKDEELLANIHVQWPELNKLLDEVNSHWIYEDLIYRYYHQSFKVYAIQDITAKIMEALKNVAPKGSTLSSMYIKIYRAGVSGKQFKLEHNRQWTVHTRPFLEAFFHAKFFLEMVVKYGKELKTAPSMLPSGWAALLCLYNLR